MPYGTARPRSLIRKSCTRTSSGWPWGCHSRPPFLKSPTSSFFFVSTEITGCCSARAAETLWLMSANWASRSGWLLPSLVLRLACRLNFCCFSSSPTTVWLIRWPRAASSLASRRRLLQVQRSGDIGSPRSLGATSASRSSSRAASVATRGLRPPPGRRTRSASSWAAVASSFKPRPIVLTAMPVARDTAAIPPYPAIRASVAANSRRLRSSRWGNSKVKRARMPVGSIIPTRYGITPLPRIQPSAPIHLFPDNHLASKCTASYRSCQGRTGGARRRPPRRSGRRGRAARAAAAAWLRSSSAPWRPHAGRQRARLLPAERLGPDERAGSLPEGVDIRGEGGYVIAPFARLPDGRSYAPIPETPNLLSVPTESIPYAPQWLVEIVRRPDRLHAEGGRRTSWGQRGSLRPQGAGQHRGRCFEGS